MGGIGTLSGAMLGAGLFKFMDFYFSKWFGESAGFLVGSIYVLIVIFLPYGLVGTWKLRQWRLREGWNELMSRLRH
jgi:branched-chain amino acid transport system permease protein